MNGTMDEVIQQRTAISAAIDEEFSAVPGEPHVRRIYDWTRHEYRTVTTIDLGAKRKQRPPTELDSAGMYSKGRKSSRPRAAPSRDAIYAYVQENGPCLVKNINEGTGIPIGTIRNALHDARENVTSYRDPAHTGSGKRVLWEWIGDEDIHQSVDAT